MRPFALACALLATLTTGCGIGGSYWPDEAQMRAFESAGPIEPELDHARLISGLPQPGAYRVVPGDLLRIHGARTFLGDEDGPPDTTNVVLARVSDAGAITVPLAGKVEVAGKTLGEIEAAIADAMHPRYLVQRPAIAVTVEQPYRVKVAVLGAVEQPGIVELTSDRLSLYGALTEAGGILKASNLKVGARIIRIRRPGEERAQALALPVKGLNVPYGDVALKGGETVEVERWEPELFTVIGLVAKPGAYEYPPNTTYNLMQAIAMAGGIDRIADPPYATVFRKDASGEVIGVTFGISGNDIVQASAVPIHAGDVIAIEHTVLSWSRALLAQVLRLQVNFFVDPFDR